MTQRIPTSLVCYLGRIRDADPRQVEGLADSIKEVGLLNPITVYPKRIIRSGREVDGYGLIAGMHRLRAAQSLGWTEIEAVVTDLDEQRRIIAECDENLCGTKLTASQVADFTAKRKAAYLALHPETAKGTAGAEAKHGRASDNLSFADDQSAKTGTNKRTVQRDAARGENIIPAALALLSGTKLDKGTFLDMLAKVDPADQVNVVKRHLAESKPAQSASTRSQSKIDGDVKDRAARSAAETIAEHVPGEWWDGIKANLYAAGARNVADALTNITGETVMDRRYSK